MMDSEYRKFDKITQKILSVSRDELKRRDEEWKREHERGKRKSKTSASVRAACAKD
jgi:hypothetical protein